MNGRIPHRWLAWLLPLLLLRSLIPTGFMLGWSDGALQIMLCSGSGPLSSHAVAVVSHVSKDGQDDPEAQHSHSGTHENSICPFAAAGTAGCVSPSIWITSFAATLISQIVAFSKPLHWHKVTRALWIRGPPISSGSLLK